MKRIISLFLAVLFIVGMLGTAQADDDEIGLGVDVKLVDFDGYIDSVNAEVKRDVQNNETQGYLVVHFDISSLFK